MLWLLKIAVIYNQGGCSSFLAINNIFCRTSKGYPFFLTISMFTWTLTRRNVRSIKLVSCHKSWPLDYLLVSKYSTFYFVYICMYIYIYIYFTYFYYHYCIFSFIDLYFSPYKFSMFDLFIHYNFLPLLFFIYAFFLWLYKQQNNINYFVVLFNIKHWTLLAWVEYWKRLTRVDDCVYLRYNYNNENK